MTKMLEQAFREAGKLPEAEQDILASRLLAELAKENAFDRKIERTTDQLAKLSLEALAEHHAGLTKPLDDAAAP